MTKKDKEIIEQNPDVAPYDLLEKGLSQKGFDELVRETDEEKAEDAPKQVKPVKTEVNAAPARAVPKLESVAPRSNPGQVYLVDTETGKKTEMSREAAERFTRRGRNNQYTIE